MKGVYLGGQQLLEVTKLMQRDGYITHDKDPFLQFLCHICGLSSERDPSNLVTKQKHNNQQALPFSCMCGLLYESSLFIFYEEKSSGWDT